MEQGPVDPALAHIPEHVLVAGHDGIVNHLKKQNDSMENAMNGLLEAIGTNYLRLGGLQMALQTETDDMVTNIIEDKIVALKNLIVDQARKLVTFYDESLPNSLLIEDLQQVD